MYTINFFFTEQATFKATSVVEINVEREDGIFSYVQQAQNKDRTIAGHNLRTIDMNDLLYAVVKDHDDGEITIIPSLYTSFDIVPTGTSVQRQKNIEEEAARVKAYREAKAPEREAKEAAKYAARRAARKAQYVPEFVPAARSVPSVPEFVPGQLPPVPPVPKFVAPVPPVATATVRSVEQELTDSGLDEESIEVLRSLDILKTKK